MADLEKLTSRQREIYEFIRERIRNRGYGPTVREIGKEFKISSPNGVMCHLRALEKKGLIHRDPGKSRAIQMSTESVQSETALPLRGRIAAGVLHEAVERDEHIDFGEMFSGEDHFVLEVQGDSMVDDQIADGDYVIVRKQQRANQGQIVVAVNEENEATLKRWYVEGDRVRLQPSNSTMSPIYLKNARILGVVTGVVRKVR